MPDDPNIYTFKHHMTVRNQPCSRTHKIKNADCWPVLTSIKLEAKLKKYEFYVREVTAENTQVSVFSLIEVIQGEFGGASA